MFRPNVQGLFVISMRHRLKQELEQRLFISQVAFVELR